MALGAGSREVCEESSSSLPLALVAGSSGSQVADNNCQMVLLCSNKLPQNKEASPAPEKRIWTKHTSLEKIKSSRATEQSTSGKCKGFALSTQCSPRPGRTSRKKKTLHPQEKEKETTGASQGCHSKLKRMPRNAGRAQKWRERGMKGRRQETR